MMNLPGYQVLAQIYESANSLVYRGFRSADGQPAIFKVLKQDYPAPTELTRYQQEYEIVRSLNLEGVVKAYSLENYQRTLVIILEDFGGESLKVLMERQNFLLPDFLKIAIEVIEIISEIHAANIIHKDINPSNIVLNQTTGQLKIIDFGMATVFSRENPTMKNPHLLEGTLAYISPEQTGRMNRSLDYRTDFYSFGVTCYEMLTGKLPFETKDEIELVHCHIAKQPRSPQELNSKIPKVVSDIVMKLLAKNPEDRYQSAWGIKADLVLCQMQLDANELIEDFSPGENDISDKFQIPQKLYGREREVETLLAAFERVAATEQNQAASSCLQQVKPGGVELMLVVGYSGIGKSALVRQIYQPVIEKRGYFVGGKFEQFQRNTPYSAVVTAFAGLVQQLLTETETQLQQWQQKLLAAFGSNGQAIVDIIPEVELIVGKQPPLPELGATEAQNRFNLLFQKFIRVFCASDHPLVIFLDDLQWADSASLKLIQLMMMDTDTKHLFLIGAYRDNEVSANHPLMLMLEELQKEGATVNQIMLTPLELEDITELISETLHREVNSVKPLAELVTKKTLGNPFFVNQFLKTLYAENLFIFNFNSLSWQWNLAQIEAKSITNNVVELMINNLRRLPTSLQRVLCLAACVGSDFDLTTLSIICEQSPVETFQALTSAIKTGLIQPTSELDSQLLIQNFKFGHDRIQQAAYTLIDETQKQALHFKIGHLLWQNTAPELLLEKIFEIVDHLNLGLGENSDTLPFRFSQAERNEIAKLNLMAAQKAKVAIAYKAAAEYLNSGLNLLAGDSWQTQYNLTLDLYTTLAEVEQLNTNFERVEQIANLVEKNAKTVLDKLKVYEAKILLYAAQNYQKTAIEIGLEVLELLGISLLEVPPQVQAIEELYELPEMIEPTFLGAMRILMSISVPAFIADPQLLSVIVFTMVNLCIKHGNSPLSAFAYAFYGLLLCGGLVDIKSGYKFGRLALQVLEKFKAREVETKVGNLFYGLIIHWKEPAQNAIEPLRETVKTGLDNGDIEFTGYAALHYCSNRLLVGKNLGIVQQEQKQYMSLLQTLKQSFSLYHAQIWGQLALNLSSKVVNPYDLMGEIFDESKMLPLLQEANNLMSLYAIYLAKTILNYLLKNYKAAITNAVLATQYEHGAIGLFTASQNPFYYSLALLADYPNTSHSEQIEALKKVVVNQQKMKLWADHAPMNFQHKYELVEAEKARVLGKFLEAEELYEKAITGARKNGYLHEEALAYELAAEFYLTRGLERIAQTYMTEAHYSYIRWGAQVKIEDLEARYPQLIIKSTLGSHLTDSEATTGRISSSGSLGEALDLATVMKASQAIASEIELAKLLASLMKILIENAGAQLGYLILESNGQLLIEASGSVEEVQGGLPLLQTNVLQSAPLENNLPVSIINYVARTKESVVKNDASLPSKFANDPYIKTHHSKSILCAPLLNQGQLLGIIYLENNLTIGAFTCNRLEVIKLLSTQAAVSIANAKLYAEVRESESKLTQFLEALPVGVSVYNPKGEVSYMNQTGQRLLCPNSLPDPPWQKSASAFQIYKIGSDRQFPTEQLPALRALKGEMVTTDDLEVHLDGKVIPLEIQAKPILDDKGNIIYAILTFQDITQRKQAEKLLAEYNRILEKEVQERTQELSQTLDNLKATQQELIQSEKMAALGQLIAGVAHEINTPLGAIRSSVQNIADFLQQNLLQLPEFLQSLTCERYLDFLALLKKSSQPASLLSSKEKRFFKRALIRQLESHGFQNADTIADTFVDIGVYDDISPFLLLLQDSHHREILQMAYQLASLQRSTQTIMTATERAAKVVFALKTYARYNSSLEKVKTHIPEGIETVLTLYQNHLKQGVEVRRSYAPDLPPVLCYPDELNQVWTNLIHNALQAMDNKGVLKIDAKHQEDSLKVSIADNGKGIAPEILPRIFEPFFTTKPPGEGSGLGLDIVKKIVEKHEGEIEVSSIPGQTIFTVSIPTIA
ncbi:MAG: AAA family ATPase [Actinomycetota bacterium]